LNFAWNVVGRAPHILSRALTRTGFRGAWAGRRRTLSASTKKRAWPIPPPRLPTSLEPCTPVAASSVVFLAGDYPLSSRFARHGGQIACRGTCLDARGLTAEDLIEEATGSTMDQLAGWTVESDQVLTF
jgi:hypothetical protein